MDTTGIYTLATTFNLWAEAGANSSVNANLTLSGGSLLDTSNYLAMSGQFLNPSYSLDVGTTYMLSYTLSGMAVAISSGDVNANTIQSLDATLQFAALPEPNTFVLGALGFLGLGVVARWKLNRGNYRPFQKFCNSSFASNAGKLDVVSVLMSQNFWNGLYAGKRGRRACADQPHQKAGEIKH